MRSRAWCGEIATLVMLVCGWPLGADEPSSGAAAPEAKVYEPASTKVAVLPFASAMDSQQPYYYEAEVARRGATKVLRRAFEKCGFRMLDQKAVEEACKKVGLGLGDEAALSKVAQEVGADLTVGGVILDCEEHTLGGYGSIQGTRYGSARVAIRVYDSQAAQYRLDVTGRGEASGSSGGVAVDSLADALGGLLFNLPSMCGSAVEDAVAKGLKGSVASLGKRSPLALVGASSGVLARVIASPAASGAPGPASAGEGTATATDSSAAADAPKQEAAGATPEAASVQQWFESLPAVLPPDKLGALNAVYQFDLTGAGGGSWTVRIRDKSAVAQQGKGSRPDCTVTVDASAWRALTSKLGALSAYAAGKLKVRGNADLAANFWRML